MHRHHRMLYSPCMAAKETTLKEIGEMLEHVVEHMATKDDLAAAESRLDRRIDKLDAKIDRLDTKLTKFEEGEIDKRKQLEVRVTKLRSTSASTRRSRRSAPAAATSSG